jgi:hypothetical protein
MTEAGLLAERLPSPSDPAEMTDDQLIRCVEYLVVDGHAASRLETMTDAQVIEDFQRITDAFHRRCPGARIPDPINNGYNSSPPHAPVSAQLALPAPLASNGAVTSTPAPTPPPEAPTADEEPIDDPPSITSWRQRRFASIHHQNFDAYARATQQMGSVTYNFPPRKFKRDRLNY